MHDIVIYGATGFTGQQLVERLATHQDAASLRLAIAGRSHEKLQRLARRYGDRFSVIVADAGDRDSVDAMVSQTKVVASTAGPFAKFSDPVVASCVKHCVDYVDITGETPWVRSLIDRFHAEASTSGTKIVPLCGFDSVPSDLGVLMIVDYLMTQFGEDTRQIKSFFSMRGGLNGGTLASAIHMAETGQVRRLGDPFLLVDGEARASIAPAKLQRGAIYDDDFGRWTAPFVMAPVNTQVVYRSHGLRFAETGAGYGARFRYHETLAVKGKGKASVVALAMGGLDKVSGSRIGRTILKTFGPQPGEGPSESTISEGATKCTFLGLSSNGSKVRARFDSRGDPGNYVTVLILAEAALCLARDRSELPGGETRGGILTPAVAFGPVLTGRLQRAGVYFQVEALEQGTCDL